MIMFPFVDILSTFHSSSIQSESCLWIIFIEEVWFGFIFKVNPSYIRQFEENGMLFVGRDVEGERMEIMEIKGILRLQILCIFSRPLSPPYGGQRVV